MRRFIIDAPVTHAATDTHVDSKDELIGETPPTKRGYSLSVHSMKFDGKGMRVRLVLQRGAEFMRHFDITTELLRDALPILETAASLGGDLLPTDEDSPWWESCTISDFRSRIDTMAASDRLTLTQEIRSKLAPLDIEVKVTGNIIAKSKLAKLAEKRRLLTECTPNDTIHRLEKKLQLIRNELIARYGDETAQQVFTAARGTDQ
jgi:hypothetical protein